MGKCISLSNKKRQELEIDSAKISFVRLKKLNIMTNYTLDKVISETRLCIVYKARHKQTDVPRCAKISNFNTLNRRKVDHIINEINLMQEIDNPNIVKLVDLYIDARHISIVTELCEGNELFDEILNKTSFSENEAAVYTRQIASALTELHLKGIVYGELNPHNLMFESMQSGSTLKMVGCWKIKRFHKDLKQLAKNSIAYYIAPESIQGIFSDKSDVWAVGVIIYTMLTGRVPFEGKSLEETMSGIQFNEPSYTGRGWKKISVEAVDLLKKILIKEPSDRISAEKIMVHPWIIKYCEPNSEIRIVSANSLKRLASINITSKFHRAVIKYIVSQVLSSKKIEKIKNLFKKLDSNGDGLLRLEEMRRGLDQSGLKMTDLDEIFHKIDKKNSGSITCTEFITETIDIKKEISREELLGTFKAFDKNGDGVISLEELAETLGEENASANYFVGMMKEADANGDGFIDLEEFCNFVLQKKVE